MLLGFPFCGRLQEPKNPRIATEVLRHQRQHDGRSRTSQQSPSGGMCQAQRTANGDLKKMHGGCYFIVMDYHFLQAKASLFVGTIGHGVCWNASALQPAIQLEVSISKSLQL